MAKSRSRARGRVPTVRTLSANRRGAHVMAEAPAIAEDVEAAREGTEAADAAGAGDAAG